MERKITIKILGRPFSLVAKSPEEEAEIRNAAERIDEKFNSYQKSFPGKNPADILSFIALNSIVEAEKYRKMLKSKNAQEQKLHIELERYLENVDKI